MSRSSLYTFPSPVQIGEGIPEVVDLIYLHSRLRFRVHQIGRGCESILVLGRIGSRIRIHVTQIELYRQYNRGAESSLKVSLSSDRLLLAFRESQIQFGSGNK